jgi:hypothetical protein
MGFHHELSPLLHLVFCSSLAHPQVHAVKVRHV